MTNRHTSSTLSNNRRVSVNWATACRTPTSRTPANPNISPYRATAHWTPASRTPANPNISHTGRPHAGHPQGVSLHFPNRATMCRSTARVDPTFPSPSVPTLYVGTPLAGVLSLVPSGGCPVHVCLTFDHLASALTTNPQHPPTTPPAVSPPHQSSQAHWK